MTRDRPSRAPSVDEGDPPRALVGLLAELAPTPGRFGNTVRLVVVVALLVTLCELFRIPEPAIAGFIAVFISKEDAATTVQGALVIGVFAMLGIGLAILCFMLTLSNPALRILLMTALSFTTMFLSRASTLGSGFFLTGFLTVFGLTYGDQLQLIGLQPSSAANTPEASAPELAFMPPEEALLHTLLWLALLVALTVAVVVMVNLLAGQDPGRLLRSGLAARLQALAAACAGQEGATARLDRLALEGTSALSKQAELSKKFRRVTPRRRRDAALVEPVGRLVVGASAWFRLRSEWRPDPTLGGTLPAGAGEPKTASLPGEAPLAPLRPVLAAWRRAVLDGGDGATDLGRDLRPTGVLDGKADASDTTSRSVADVPAFDAVFAPLLADLDETLQSVAAAFRLDAGDAAAAPSRAGRNTDKKSFALMRPDAFTNPDYPRFGFKVTLAALICYLSFAGANWPQIHTALVTCFFVPQETLGQTLHKSTLRICGCLLGATLGIVTILLFMPAMTDIGQLLLAIGLVTFLGAWISNGSARTSYAGLQFAFAFYLVILQGFGPTLDMQTGRDRAIGIMFGIAVTSIIFATIWPVRVATLVRARLAAALEQLADPAGRPGERPALQSFTRAAAAARDLLVHDAFERRVMPRGDAGVIDARLLTSLQALVVPMAIVLRLAEARSRDRDGTGAMSAETQGRIVSYHRALSCWLREAAGWVRERAPATRFRNTLPSPPELPPEGATASQAAWYARLDAELRAILERLTAVDAERRVPTSGDPYAAA